jgi:hypothetical protein
MTELLQSYNLLGLAIGLCTFLVIGMFHPIVIKSEYYFGVKCRWWFVLLGIVMCAVAILVSDIFWSAISGVVAFSSFWSVKEIVEQRERVRKGWFPRNPKRKED